MSLGPSVLRGLLIGDADPLLRGFDVCHVFFTPLFILKSKLTCISIYDNIVEIKTIIK